MLTGLARRLTAVSVSLSLAMMPLTAVAQDSSGQAGDILQPGNTQLNDGLLKSGDPQPAGGLIQPQAGDPPARVGRLAALSGTVSYHLAGATQWEPAQLNLPATTGTALWTEPGAQAVLEAAGTRMVLDQATELDLQQLDDHALVAAVPQGRAYVHLLGQRPGDSTTLETPRGRITLLRAGEYEIAAGDTGTPTVLTVMAGEAEMTVSGAIIHVAPHEAATISGDGQALPFEARVAAAVPDPFLSAQLNQERPVRRSVVAPPPDVAQMTGGTELEQYGDWATTPDYGPVWYPPVVGYVPYRQGRWAFVQPWGWTWVDDAPWGFAPSHYGRWAEFNNRWGWIPGQPGYVGYPVYAPAVVSFLAGAAVGALAVGWVPLGPREAYYPPYRVSDGYVRNLNINHVQNITNVVTTYNTRIINNQPGGVPQGGFVNRQGATTVPVAAMAGSRNLAGLARPIGAGGLPANAAFVPRPAVLPTQATLGMTPAVAQQLRLPGGPGGAGRPAAPGPALRAAVGVPGTDAGVGTAPGAGLGAGTGPQPGAQPGGGLTRPGAALLGGAVAGGAVAGGAVAGGAVAGALLRPKAAVPGAMPTVVRPGGASQMAPNPAVLPALRQPGQVVGMRPNGGAPGPALQPGGSQISAPRPSPAPPAGAGLQPPGGGASSSPMAPRQVMPGPQASQPLPEARTPPAPVRAVPHVNALPQVHPAPPPQTQTRPQTPPQTQLRPQPQVQRPSPQVQRPSPQVQRPPPQIREAPPPQQRPPPQAQFRPPPHQAPPPRPPPPAQNHPRDPRNPNG